ncbi:MAG: aldo/keto reductase, partial [Calditrichia bacterium]|nr:aldo/keto reductase [Calditrichia bacterium]
WAIGGQWQYGWGKQDDDESVAAIEYALENGINWIDTAAVYGLGHSEKIVGKVLQGKRDKVFLATKCGLLWDDKGVVEKNIEPKSIRKECENSLKRLNVDYIDLYQIHWPDKEIEKAWEEMIRLKEEGKVKYIGVSNFDENEIARCEKLAPVQSIQPPFAMLRRGIEEKILPLCKQENIGVVAYSPMMSGLLSGKFNIDKIAEDDWRRGFWGFQEPFLGKALQLVEELKPIAEKYNKSMVQLSIAWVLNNPRVTSAIVGARRPEQVKEIIGGSGWKIENADMQIIEDKLQNIMGDMLYWK